MKKLINSMAFELKEAIQHQKNFSGGMEEYINTLQDSDTFYNEAHSKGTLYGLEVATVNIIVSLIDEAISKKEEFDDSILKPFEPCMTNIINSLKNQYLFYMGYYGHDKEEDKETDKLSNDSFMNYFIEKRTEIFTEEEEEL